MTRRLALQLAGVAFVLIAASFWGMRTVGRGMDAENRLTAKRLERAFLPLLFKAHRLHDDLALQEAVGALAQAPGLGFAGVLDAGDTALAHSRLDELGKRWKAPRDVSKLARVPLKEGATRWGTLVFSMSTRSTDSLRRTLAAQAAAFCLFVWALIGWILRCEARRLAHRQSMLEDERALRAELEADVKRLEARLKTQGQDAQRLIACALEVLSEPVVLLDARQRVAGAHLISGAESWIGRSWQEVPGLQDRGHEVEETIGVPRLFKIVSAHPPI